MFSGQGVYLISILPPNTPFYLPFLGVFSVVLAACAYVFYEYSQTVEITVSKRFTHCTAVGLRPLHIWRWKVEFWLFFIAFFFTGAAALFASNFLFLLVLFELITFITCFFLLVWDRHSVSGFENALVYFLLSSFFSLLYVFGLVHVILVAGHVDLVFSVPFQGQWYRISFVHNVSEALLLGLVLFKLGVVPLHSWVVPIYATTNIAILGLFSSAYKVLYVSILLKLTVWATSGALFSAEDAAVSGWLFSWFLGGIGLLSVFIGAVLLVGQTTLRGFVAASGIYNMGFVLLAFACGPVGAAVGLLFAAWYSLTILFFIYNCLKFRVGAVGLHGFNELPPPHYLVHFAGLSDICQGQNRSIHAISLLLFDFMAFPPLPGFVFKFNIIFLVVSTLWTLPFAFLLFTVFLTVALPATLFCYFRIFKLCWFDAPLPHVRTIAFFVRYGYIYYLLLFLFGVGFSVATGVLLPFFANSTLWI